MRIARRDVGSSSRPSPVTRRRFLTVLGWGPIALAGCAQGKTGEKVTAMDPGSLVSFVGGTSGPWRVLRTEAVRGPALTPVMRLAMQEGGPAPATPGSGWVLRGVVSHLRYMTARERDQLAAIQAGLGRPEATRAALIPIRKSEAWWQLAQDERRAIFEERSKHIGESLKYLPAVARRLHHSRDLGEPFDFLTWFEYSPAHAGPFEELVQTLRRTEEWKYVEREVDIRVSRE